MLESIVEQMDPKELSRILSNNHKSLTREDYLNDLDEKVSAVHNLGTGKPANEKEAANLVKSLEQIGTADINSLLYIFPQLISLYPNWNDAFSIMNKEEKLFNIVVSKFLIDKVKGMERITRKIPYAIHGFNAAERYAKSADKFIDGVIYKKKCESKGCEIPRRDGNSYILSGLGAAKLHDIIEESAAIEKQDPDEVFEKLEKEFSETVRTVLGDGLLKAFAEETAVMMSAVYILSNKGVGWLEYIQGIKKIKSTPVFDADKQIQEIALACKGCDSGDNITTLEGYEPQKEAMDLIKQLIKGFYVATVMKTHFKKWRKEHPETEILWNQLQQNLATNYLVARKEVKKFEDSYMDSKRKQDYWKRLLYTFTETGFLGTSTLKQRRYNGKPNYTLFHGYTELMANFLSHNFTERTKEFIARIENFDKKEIYRTLLGLETASVFNLAGKDHVFDLKMSEEK